MNSNLLSKKSIDDNTDDEHRINSVEYISLIDRCPGGHNRRDT